MDSFSGSDGSEELGNLGEAFLLSFSGESQIPLMGLRLTDETVF
jgi:hypothetical protein